MVEAGESSGTLDTVLDRVAVQIEKEAQIKRRVKGAMVYPAVVIAFASLVLTFMLLFIIPVFVNVFDDLNGELPKLTQIVMQAFVRAAPLLVHHLPRDRRGSSSRSAAGSAATAGGRSGIASS